MNLGELKYIDDLRTIWAYEEREFTPWLAENINLLAEALGLDLEVLSIEHGVGAFSLDILAKDTVTGNIVAIENQLETTDHSHLGQLLTYASGVDAKTVIWISKYVREEHQEAIDWLNQISNEDIEFFAVEIKLIKIDNSAPAPFFNIKASPNDWSKEQKTRVASNIAVSERQEYYKQFFTLFLGKVNQKMPGLTNSKKVSYDAWKSFPSGVSGYSYSAAFRSGNRFSIELYIDCGDKERNKQRYDSIYSNKEDIESELGNLSWERLENKKACRIAVYVDYTNDDEMLDWGIDMLGRFINAFKCHLRSDI